MAEQFPKALIDFFPPFFVCNNGVNVPLYCKGVHSPVVTIKITVDWKNKQILFSTRHPFFTDFTSLKYLFNCLVYEEFQKHNISVTLCKWIIIGNKKKTADVFSPTDRISWYEVVYLPCSFSISLLIIAHAWLICCNVQQFQLLKLLTWIYFTAAAMSLLLILWKDELQRTLFFFPMKAVLTFTPASLGPYRWVQRYTSKFYFQKFKQLAWAALTSHKTAFVLNHAQHFKCCFALIWQIFNLLLSSTAIHAHSLSTTARDIICETLS